MVLTTVQTYQKKSSRKHAINKRKLFALCVCATQQDKWMQLISLLLHYRPVK